MNKKAPSFRSRNLHAESLEAPLLASSRTKGSRSFGFGQPTGIDYPGESVGFILPLSQWSETTIGNVPYGQGVAVTPIQLASVYAAIANGGIWIQPHLVERVGSRGPQRWRRRRIISPTVDADLEQMLSGVVTDPSATGPQAAIPGYAVAGKTGTAQVADGHGYSATDYTASFVGRHTRRAHHDDDHLQVRRPHRRRPRHPIGQNNQPTAFVAFLPCQLPADSADKTQARAARGLGVHETRVKLRFKDHTPPRMNPARSAKRDSRAR